MAKGERAYRAHGDHHNFLFCLTVYLTQVSDRLLWRLHDWSKPLFLILLRHRSEELCVRNRHPASNPRLGERGALRAAELEDWLLCQEMPPPHQDMYVLSLEGSKLGCSREPGLLHASLFWEMIPWVYTDASLNQQQFCFSPIIKLNFYLRAIGELNKSMQHLRELETDSRR